MEEKGAKLKKEVGLFSGISFVIGTMIGSGIFISPGGVISQSGSVAMSLIVWILCGLLAMLASLCYVELGLMIPESGGEYPYLKAGIGRWIAYICSWINFFCTRPASFGIICQGFANYALAPFNIDPGKESLVNSIVTIAAVCK